MVRRAVPVSIDHNLVAAAQWECGSSDAHVAALVTQTQSAQELFNGGYDGHTTIGDAFEGSWLGLGVSEHLDGELVCVDGVVWRVRADGLPVLADPNQMTPFSVAERRAAPQEVNTMPVPPGLNLEGLLELIEHELDQPVTLRLSGSFRDVVLRSERPQKPPYRRLDEVLESDEVRFGFQDWQGVMVGYRFPTAAGGVLLPGLHLHGISDDHLSGGHVKKAVAVDVAMSFVRAKISVTLRSDDLRP